METKKFEVIYVDDERDILSLMSDVLDELNYKTVCFDNASEAVTYVQENKSKISIIISDLRMDHMNGFEFKKELNKFASEIPFIILTGYWTKEMSSEAMSLGIQAFIEKPIAQNQLADSLHKYAAARIEQLNDELEMVVGFLEETTPMLDEIEQLILELEENPDNDQTLSVYFRLLHTIKGTASCVGLVKLGNFTHHYEDFIGELRNKVIPVNAESTDILLYGLDRLKFYFEKIQEVGIDSFIDVDAEGKRFDSQLIKRVAANTNHVQVVDQEEKTGKKTDGKDDKMIVPMNVLNEFMEESGELTVIRNTILKTVKKIENRYRGDREIELLNELLDGMYNVTSNIQGKITEMRKVPLQNTFRPFKRLIRDLSKKLDKEVELEIVGDDLLVDNTIAKLFSNTLIHIIRNSLDHAIETPDKRIEAGKDKIGLIRIEASEVGEDIMLKIHDDGAGINPEKIKEKAIEQGLYTHDELERMSTIEIVNIIFQSGFSTAEIVSDLSGRGVGMDMVRGSFEEIGGEVYVKSQIGVGSEFTLRAPIPKSVLIINTLSVSCSDQVFIFHMNEVAEVVRYEVETPNTKMYEIDGKMMLSHNDEMIELVELAELVQLEARKKSDILNIVVLRQGRTRFGVLVDEIYEFEEVVARKIPEQVASGNLYHGASLMGNGEAAMIFSAQGLADKACIEVLNEAKKTYVEEDHFEQSGDIKEYMVFRYDESQLLSVDLDDVERLETFDASNFEYVGNKLIVRYLDKALPIVEPSTFLGLSEKGQIEEVIDAMKADQVEVIVVQKDGQKMGLLVAELDEIKHTYEVLDETTIDVKGLSGSIYIDGKTICVLDIPYLFKKYKEDKVQINISRIRLAA